MSTRSGRIRPSAVDVSPPKTRKGVSPPRSPARTRKSSPPARSPTRKSPSRKSPSRKPASKFPARKSPSRTTKDVSETAPKAATGLAKRAPIKSVSEANIQIVEVTKLESYRTTRGRRSEYSIKDFSSLSENEYASGDGINGVESIPISKDVYGLRNRKTEDIAPRRSGRLKEFTDNLPDIKRSLSKSVSKSISQSIDTFSDEENFEDDLKKNKSVSATRKLATPLRDSVSKLAQFNSRWEFGGRIGSGILMLLIPVTVFSLLISCSKPNKCSYKSLADFSKYFSLSIWYSPLAVGLVVGQCALQAIVACLPIFGTRADRLDESGQKYVFNGFFASIITVSLVTVLNILQVLNSGKVLEEYLRLATTMYLLSVILAIIMYIKSKNLDDSDLNPYGNTGYVLYDFWMGRENHPYIKNLNVKICISRICNNTTLILALLYFKHGFILPTKLPETQSLDTYKALLSTIQYHPTILVTSAMQIVYILSYIVKEHKITTTFFWQSEGVGHLQSMSSAFYPFFFVIPSKFVTDVGVSLSTNILVGASALFLTGLTIMTLSNNIKHDFRINPLHPSLTHLDSMPTFHGKKLLVSNLWGMLRHPNYTGDMLVHLALMIVGIASRQPLVTAPPMITIVSLLYRAWRDHSRCRRRYGAAWQRYCKKVPSVVLPKIL